MSQSRGFPAHRRADHQDRDRDTDASAGITPAGYALSVPTAGIGQTEYYPCFADKAAAMVYKIIKGHPLVDGNKRVGYVCLLEFVYRNGYEWSPPPDEGTERTETVEMIEGVAAGSIEQGVLADWIRQRLVEPRKTNEE